MPDEECRSAGKPLRFTVATGKAGGTVVPISFLPFYELPIIAIYGRLLRRQGPGSSLGIISKLLQFITLNLRRRPKRSHGESRHL